MSESIKHNRKPFLSYQTQYEHRNSNGNVQGHALLNDENGNLLERAEQLKHDLNETNSKFNNFISDIFSNQSIKLNKNKNEWNYSMNAYEKEVRNRDDDNLPERVFVKRESLLTEMFKLADIRTIRHLFVTILCVLMLQVLCNDKFEKGKIDLDFDLIKWCFGKFNVVFFTWIHMKLSTACVVYYGFYHWSHNRIAYNSNKDRNHYNNYDITWLIIFIVYLLIFLICPPYVVIINQLPIASSITLLAEQLRLVMKTYAFVRTNIPRALNFNQILIEKESSSDADDNNNSNGEQILTRPCPSFSNYLYFLFIPTLIYRDSYPRNSQTKWNVVFSNLAQVCGTIFYTYYVLQRFCIPVFRHFNTEHLTFKMFLQSILNCVLPGALLLVIVFYSFLHCWMNAFAEMLRFGDRMFYRDWWNSRNYSNYYRTWNIVVHDWLYTYIYRDIYYLLGKNYKILAQFIIFVISALFHEYILTLSFGFFYPVLCLMFGSIGFAFMFIKPKDNSDIWNLIFWLLLVTGLGCLMCLYSVEWYARQNCPQSFDSKFLDFVLPRSFTCGLNKNTNNDVNGSIKTEL